jgi:outer membrane murein-binding lipoprotein Lpp
MDDLTNQQKIQKINQIMADYQAKMHALRVKRNQVAENYVQQVANSKANRVVAFLRSLIGVR